MKNRYTWIIMILILAMPLCLAQGEGTVFSLKDITYTVDSVYFDGQVAEVRVLQTAVQPDTALVDALSYKPKGTESPMSDAYALASNVIGSYCEMTCATVDGKYKDILYSLGHGFASGIEMDATFYWWMPYGEELEEAEVHVTVGSRTKEAEEYDEMRTFPLRLSKTAEPLLHQQMDLELEEIHIKQITVCRTPQVLTLRVYYRPGPQANDPSFTVATADGTALGPMMMNDKRKVDGQTDMMEREFCFSLEENQQLPEALLLKYSGKSPAKLLLDLQKNTVELQ